MCSLFLASVIMFFQTIINLLLLKSYYKFYFFSRSQRFSILFVLNYMVWLCSLVYAILDIIKSLCWDESRSKAYQSFSIFHWNLSSISAYNYTKIYLLTAYVLVQNFDIICSSGTYLNSETATDHLTWFSHFSVLDSRK